MAEKPYNYVNKEDLKDFASCLHCYLVKNKCSVRDCHVSHRSLILKDNKMIENNHSGKESNYSSEIGDTLKL